MIQKQLQIAKQTEEGERERREEEEVSDYWLILANYRVIAERLPAKHDECTNAIPSRLASLRLLLLQSRARRG
jgi:hypothetical protein